ncbi:hypothetical protein [Bdellovibrio bacteriovorus]|uniref:hypothetical protein n=1 Tax=Bdellovibrio bacteriovorus TaxID=959 RepID=UPI0035A65E3C
MNSKLIFALTVFILSLAASQAEAAIDSATEKASRALGAAMATEISFKESSADLNDRAKKEIQDIIAKSGNSGKIEEVKVAVWADREYPAADTRASDQDIDLAKRRADNIRRYIKSETAVRDVDVFNMSERPNALQKFLSTPDAKLKKKMESSGAAPRTDKEAGVFNQRAKASKALIMVYTE